MIIVKSLRSISIFDHSNDRSSSIFYNQPPCAQLSEQHPSKDPLFHYPFEEFTSGHADEWDIIFSFLGGLYKQEHYMSLLLTCKHLRQILLQNDEFAFFQVRSFSKRKTSTRPMNLPSVEFLRSKRGVYLCRYFCCAMDRECLQQLLLTTEQQEHLQKIRMEQILELLKHYTWNIEDLKRVVMNFRELKSLVDKCDQIMTMLTVGKYQIDSDKISSLLQECMGYVVAANSFGESISSCCEHLVKICNKFRSHKQIVLAAVRNDGCTLAYVSNELKNDREVVLTAVTNYGYTLKYASSELRNDREIVLSAVQSYGYILQYASPEIRNDREIVLAAVENNGYALEYATARLQADRDVVLAAVRRYGCALKYASDEMKSDRKIVKAAVRNNRYAIRYASEKLLREFPSPLDTLIQHRAFADYV